MVYNLRKRPDPVLQRFVDVLSPDVLYIIALIHKVQPRYSYYLRRRASVVH